MKFDWPMGLQLGGTLKLIWQPLDFHIYSLRFKIKVTFGHKLRYKIKVRFWWNFSQTLPNEVECCQKQCKCCCWWTTKSTNNLHLFNNWYLDLMVSTHINMDLCALVPSAQNDMFLMKLAPKVFNLLKKMKGLMLVAFASLGSLGLVWQLAKFSWACSST